MSIPADVVKLTGKLKNPLQQFVFICYNFYIMHVLNLDEKGDESIMIENIKADLVFKNGHVLTVDKGDTIHEALAVTGNKIIFVGSGKDIADYINEKSEVIDLKGRSLIPGFIDSHLHTAILGANSLAIDCRSPGVSSIGDIKKLIAEVAKKTPKGVWIRGWGYDHSKLAEQRHPTKWDIDEAAPDNPVILTRVCAHMSVHNSKSLELLQINDDSVACPGGEIERLDGKVTGLLKENEHMAAMKIAKLSMDELVGAIGAANDMLIKEGITSVHDSGGYGPDQMRAVLSAIKEGKLKIRFYAMIFSFVDNLQFIDSLISTGLYTTFGDESFKLGPVKLMIDGSSSGPTAATLEPYASNPDSRGILSMEQEAVDDVIARAHANGWQVTCHAVGDRAITVIINAIEKALKKYPRKNHRHRIEHCAIMNDELFKRVKENGIVPIPQPIFLYEFGDGYMRNYGRERAYRMFPSGSFAEKGIIAAGSSDCPITFSNPLLNMQLAMTRKTQSGQVINPDECVSVKQALRMFTYNGAYASFEEDIKGSLEVGKLADMAVLSDSLFDTPADKVRDLKVDMTYIDGRLVYER